jgi:hypothetical protein
MSTMSIGPLSPLYCLPPEICYIIWELLSPREIARVARVNKLWYEFSQPFLVRELGDVIMEGITMSQVQYIDYTRQKKSKTMTEKKRTTFFLKTTLVRKRKNFLAEEAAALEEADFLFFLFEGKGKTSS